MLEHVKSNIGMWAGNNPEYQIIKEIIDNAVDESKVDLNRLYTVKILVFVNKTKSVYQIALVDHGRGIPIDTLTKVYSESFVSGKYDAAAYGGGTTGNFGVGAKATAALSRQFISMSSRPDGFAGVRISDLKVQDQYIDRRYKSSEENVGTIVWFETDASIMNDMHQQFMTRPTGFPLIVELLQRYTAFNDNVRFEVYQINGLKDDDWVLKTSYKEKYNELHELVGKSLYSSPNPSKYRPQDYVRWKFGITSKTIWEVSLKKSYPTDQSFVENQNDFGFSIELYLCEDYPRQNGLIGFVNGLMINNDSMSHIEPVLGLIKEKLVPYFDDDAKDLIAFFRQSYTLPVYGFIDLTKYRPRFTNQTKDGFRDPQFEEYYRSSLAKHLGRVPSGVWMQMFNSLIQNITEKFLQSQSRSMKTGKSLRNVAYDMLNVGSYTPCKSNNKNLIELFITEGKSAAGGICHARNPEFQAVFMLQGKPLNVFTSNASKTKVNVVYQDLVRLLGVSPHDKNLDNLNFSKIWLLADADPDGYHIVALLLGTLMSINPLLLSSGRVCISNPPLYAMSVKGMTKSVFLRNRRAVDDARVEMYRTMITIFLKDVATGKIIRLERQAYRDFIYALKALGIQIERLAKRLNVTLLVAELFVAAVDYLKPGDVNCEEIQKLFHLDDCFVMDDGSTLVTVSADLEEHLQLKGVYEIITENITPLIKNMLVESYDVLITTTKTTEFTERPVSLMYLYSLLLLIDKNFPIRRFKGLGECSTEQLEVTCVNPKTRTYQVVHDIGEAEIIYRLLGVDTSARKELVDRDYRSLLEGDTE